MPAVPPADQALLQQLLLGQLPTAEVERLATEYAADERLATLAESLANSDDDLLGLLRRHETAVLDSDGERLVERLLERLKPVLPPETASLNQTNVHNQPSASKVTGVPEELPAKLEYYRPIKILGQGGMGTVYLAEDTRLGREVAIKTLRPELAINPQAKERFLREARTAAKLEHDHIIPIYSVGEADGTPFLAMPLLKGEPLDALIRRTAGPLPVAVVVRIAREAAAGLAAAHERGLIHRDIKPGNIWLEAPIGRVKILDFGLAKAADAGSEADSETNLTASGAIVGTPAYMAPEQASGYSVDGRADLFSLGCVLYELLTGKRAFTGPNTMSILMNLANHTPAAPDMVSAVCPEGLSRLVMQLLEKNPANRPATAAAVIQALDDLQWAPANRVTDTVEIPPSSTSRDATALGLTSTTAAPGSMPPVSPTAATQATRSSEDPRQTLASRQRPPRRFKVALALCGALTMLLYGVVYYVKSNQGTLVVTIEDDAVQAILEKEGLVIRDKNSNSTWKITTGAKKTVSKSLDGGDYQVEVGKGLQLIVIDDNGGEVMTDEFTLKRKGERRILVTLMPPSAVVETENGMSADPDRRAAEYVLSIGGNVTIFDQNGERDAHVGDLPRGAFETREVFLNHNSKVSDAGLASFRGCRNLTTLVLYEDAQITDAGLEHFKDCKKLTRLDLYSTQVTDAGLIHFKDCKNLTYLRLATTAVRDAGLAQFKECKAITLLDLNGAKNVGDAGLAHFRGCKFLTNLGLNNTQVSDAGLAEFKDCENLAYLGLAGTKVSDAGIGHFKDCKKLVVLEVQGTQVTGQVLDRFQSRDFYELLLNDTSVSDAILDRLADYSKLKQLRLSKTKVTEAGVKKLAAALPECKIEWDGGVIEPNISPDRRAAEWVLSIGGFVGVNGQALIAATTDLPSGTFKLTGIHVDGDAATKVNDAGLACFQDCTHLTAIYLKGQEVTDVGLGRFKKCTNLQDLKLFWTPITDAGLAQFKDCKLASLCLFETPVTDKGLAQFKDLSELTELVIYSRVMTDAGMARFRECKRLKSLNLSGIQQFSDAAFAHFQDCRELVTLILEGTRVTGVGIAHFKNCQDLRILSLGRTGVNAVDLANLKGFRNLTELYLGFTSVTDADLEHVAEYPKIAFLIVQETKVTEAGLTKLATMLPGCRIRWNGGDIEPVVTPDRRSAEYVLSIGGDITIRVNGKDQQLVPPATLPPVAFELTAVRLESNPKVNDEGLANFKDCESLTSINLLGTVASDAALTHFKGCKNLTQLHVSSTLVTDAGLAEFSRFPKLISLSVAKTKVTEMGVKALSAALPDCKIEWDGGVVEPVKP